MTALSLACLTLSILGFSPSAISAQNVDPSRYLEGVFETGTEEFQNARSALVATEVRFKAQQDDIRHRYEASFPAGVYPDYDGACDLHREVIVDTVQTSEKPFDGPKGRAVGALIDQIIGLMVRSSRLVLPNLCPALYSPGSRVSMITVEETDDFAGADPVKESRGRGRAHKYVMVLRGMIDQSDNDSEFAAVIAHELAHLSRHHMRDELVLREDLGEANVPKLASDNWIFEYQNENEIEADRLGAEYLARAGYDPRGLIEIFEKRQKLAKGTDLEAKMRMELLEKMLPELQGLASPTPRPAPVLDDIKQMLQKM